VEAACIDVVQLKSIGFSCKGGRCRVCDCKIVDKVCQATNQPAQSGRVSYIIWELTTERQPYTEMEAGEIPCFDK